MRIERHVVARKAQWLVALPVEVRRHLELTAGLAVYWHVVTKGQVSLTVTGHVRGGRPRAGVNCPNCAPKDRRIAELLARDEQRDRTLYAWGFSDGRQDEWMRTDAVGQQARARRLRLRAAALAMPDDPATTRRREQRERRVARGELRRQGRPGRQTVEVPAPPLETPPPSAPSPSESSGGDAASGGEAPQAAH